MMRFGILMFATASMFSLSAHAQTLSFGIGSASCATWKLNATRDFEGKTWILGFWSGLNAAADKANFVGIDTDPPAILAEIADLRQIPVDEAARRRPHPLFPSEGNRRPEGNHGSI
jgi:hypothetical protein